MRDSVTIKAPAKLNLFLRIIGQKNNGYHIIRTGITFLDLHDVVNISLSDINDLSYTGHFKPLSVIYKNDIIIKVLDKISLKKNIKINVKITKNIPWKAGLGSASTDAASLIKGLQMLGLIDDIDNNFLSKIGADVPACYYGHNCLATGIGEKINKDIDFPKYYFVLINPKIQLSTSAMYHKIKEYLKLDTQYINQASNLKNLQKYDNGNDFEKIVRNENKQILYLLNFLSNLKNSIFSRMTGSGACCYVAFESKKNAKNAFDIIAKKYSDYWIYLAENNSINNQ